MTGRLLLLKKSAAYDIKIYTGWAKKVSTLIFAITSYAACHFYREMHYSAKRGIEIACRLSVRRSACL